jgi:hypothetical protein
VSATIASCHINKCWHFYLLWISNINSYDHVFRVFLNSPVYQMVLADDFGHREGEQDFFGMPQQV